MGQGTWKHYINYSINRFAAWIWVFFYFKQNTFNRLDEPLANLDGSSRIKILEYLKVIHSELEIPMLYVSHSFSEVSALADRVIVLAHGKIIGDGPPELLLTESKYPGIIFGDEI